MANYQLRAKREATVQGISYWINGITGEDPLVVRKSDGATIKWKPGQAKRMTNYLLSIGKSSKGQPGVPGSPGEKGLNVDLELMPVIVPFVVKKYWLYATGWTLAVVGLTRLVNR